MTRMPELPQWEDEIELISRRERVSGGLDGVANRPLKSLANRTRYLKEAADESDKLIAEKVSAVKTFDEGATLESPREEIMYGAYRLVWTGKFPKTVLAGSTPQSTGGVGAGCWAYTSDAVIRQTMISADGFKLIGQVPSYASLKNIIPERPGQRVLLAAYHPGGKTGGGEFIAVSGVAPDDGGTICVPAGQANWYWKRVNIASYDVTWFGAVASDDTATYTAANTVSIQNALNAAEKAGLAAVWFPVAETFYPCGTIYVPAGVSLMGSRTKALFGATVYLRSSSNIVVSQLFKDIWCKRSFFRLWDPNAVNAQISNIRFSNCFIDGTSLTGGGKATGHAIQVRNPVFDVHFDRTYVWNYTGNGFDMVVDNAATPIPYLATGVFTTFSDGKIFNCDGAGILIQGAAADSTDVHLINMLLDHNGINLQAIGTRAPGMGEQHIYCKNCRFEFATTYSIHNTDSTVHFDGWSMAPSSGNKFYVSPGGKIFVSGRISGSVENGRPDNFICTTNTIATVNFPSGNANPWSVVPVSIVNTTRSGILQERRLKMSFTFNGAAGFTFQKRTGYAAGAAPRYAIGDVYDGTVSAIVTGTAAISVGAGNTKLTAWTESSVISMQFGESESISYCGHGVLNRNTTGKAVTITTQTDASGKTMAIILFDAVTGAYINPLSLTGTMDISFDIMITL